MVGCGYGRRMRRSPVPVVLVGLALVVGACSAGAPDVVTERADAEGGAVTGETATEPVTTESAEPPDDPDTTDPGAVDPDTTGPDTAEPTPESDDRMMLDWAPCDVDAADPFTTIECATLRVPIDHADPTSSTIDIAVARVPASGSPSERIGSLVFNPGGPGGSGIEILEFLPLTMSGEISRRFDLVGFDPRGVAASTAVECPVEFDDAITLLPAGDDAGWEQLVAATQDDLASCTDESIDIAPYLGTNNAARDLDVLREALGDDQLSYVGYSYGTRLGATYAELFPRRVRALVLDAGVKPTDDFDELDGEQGNGFDSALENFAAACDADADCVLRDLGPTLEVYRDLVDEIAEVGSFPTDDPDRRLEPGELALGVVASLYSKETWPFLAQALFVAEVEQDGSLLQALGDRLVGRQPDGSYDNSQMAGWFINCADDPERPTLDEQRAAAEEAAARSTYFGDLLRADTGCVGIPESAEPLLIGTAEGAAPIVVIGNTGDPATPFEWSVELADTLESAVLYRVEAEGHTAYGSIDCVTDDIDAYLVDLVVPADGAGCSDNADADFFVPAADSDVGQVLAFFDCLRENGADIPEFTTADLIADPTLDSILGELDFGDPDLIVAVDACFDLIPDI